MRALVCILFFGSWLLGAQELALGPATATPGQQRSNVRNAGVAETFPVAVTLLSQPWWDPATSAGCSCLIFAAGSSGSADPSISSEEVRQNRSRFAGLIRMGHLKEYDEIRHVVSFTRAETEHPAREPGPLEDEATASAARNALSVDYARIKLKFHLTCNAGVVSISALPDDPSQAAAALDHILILDGVRVVSAQLPAPLRLPR